MVSINGVKSVQSDPRHSDELKYFFGYLVLFNLIVWIPFIASHGVSFGLGNDSIIHTPAIESLIHRGNSFFDPMLRMYEARTDLFSLPYFGIYYPFYGYFGFEHAEGLEAAFRFDTKVIILHYLIASFNFSLLLYKMRVAPLLAVVGGIFYAYSPYLNEWSSWIWNFCAYAWLPLSLLGVWLAIVERKYLLGTILVAVATGLTALATSLPLVYLIIATFTMYLGSLAYAGFNKDVLIKATLAISLGGVIGLMIGASHVIPSLVRSAEFIRWHDSGSTIGGLKPPYEATLNSLIDEWGLLHLVIPLEVKSKLGNPYIGPLLIFMWIPLIFVSKQWRAFCIPTFLIGGVFLLDAMGDVTPVHRIIYSFPILGSIRYPVAGTIISVIFILIVGIKSLDYFSKEKEFTQTKRLTLLGLSIFFGLILFSQKEYQEHIISIFNEGAGWQALNITLISCLITFGVIAVTNRSSLFILPAICIVPIYLMSFHPKMMEPNDDPYVQCDEFKALQNSLRNWRETLGPDMRLAASMDYSRESSSCLTSLRVSNQVIESMALAEGWNVLLPYMSPRPYKEFKRFQLGNRLSDLNGLHAMDVTHILTNKERETLPKHLKYLGLVGPYSLFEVENYQLGGEQVGCLKGTGKKGNFFISENGQRFVRFDPAKMKVFKGLFCNKKVPFIGIVTAESRSESGSRLTYNIATDVPGLLLTTRVFNKNWKAFVNNEQVHDLIEIDDYRLAVPVGAGKSIVELKYKPLDFRIGQAISLIGFLILISLCVFYYRNRKGNQ